MSEENEELIERRIQIPGLHTGEDLCISWFVNDTHSLRISMYAGRNSADNRTTTWGFSPDNVAEMLDVMTDFMIARNKPTTGERDE